jgi:hypothetical protein
MHSEQFEVEDCSVTARVTLKMRDVLLVEEQLLPEAASADISTVQQSIGQQQLHKEAALIGKMFAAVLKTWTNASPRSRHLRPALIVRAWAAFNTELHEERPHESRFGLPAAITQAQTGGALHQVK